MTLFARLLRSATCAPEVVDVVNLHSDALENGGSQPLATLFLEVDTVEQSQSAAGVVFGGESFGGRIGSTLVYPILVGALGQVATLNFLNYYLDGLVESTDDAFDIEIGVQVTNADGTQQASCNFGLSLPPPVTSLASAGTPSGGAWSIDTGDDLVADGDSLTSTAGGNFFVSLTVNGSWD